MSSILGMNWWYLPVVAQGSLILMDEVLCHYRRKLRPIEKLSHIVDTLTLVICFSFTLLVPVNETSEKMWLILAVVSCLSITKDEWIHAREANGFEHWLHALLFVVHPLVLTGCWYAWRSNLEAGLFFRTSAVLVMSAFLLYQITGLIYGTLVRRK